MKIKRRLKLHSNWWLLQLEGGEVVLHQLSALKSYRSEDLVQVYSSWGLLPARVNVTRMVAALENSARLVRSPLVAKFCAWETKQAVISLRTTASRKSAYVKAAQAAGQTLTEWMVEACDAVAGFAAE